MPLSLVAGFDVTVAELIDARFLITASANRFDLAYFDSGNTITGLTTFASESQEYFILSDQPNFGNESGWSKIYISDPGGTNLNISGSISASNNISSSGTIIGNNLTINGSGNFIHNITASGNISASGTINASLTELSSNQLVVYDTTSGQLHYTSSTTVATPNLEEVLIAGSETSIPITSSAGVILSGSGNIIAGIITSSGNISSSGTLIGNNLSIDGSGNFKFNISASNITASGTIIGNDLTINGSGNFTNDITASNISASNEVEALFFNANSNNGYYISDVQVLTQITSPFNGFQVGSSIIPLNLEGTSIYTDNPFTASIISASDTISSSNGYFPNGSNIGPAEDGTYTDGLFTDFTTGTKVGTAVDRFNEILLALCPSPAPNMQTLGGSTGFIEANLAFGASNPIATPYPITNVTAVGDLPALDAGDLYPVAGSNISGSSGDFRLGVNSTADGYVDIRGNTNQSIAQDGGTNGNAINYNAFSFGNGNEGELYFYLNNDDTPHITLDLESSDGIIVAASEGLSLEVSPTSSGFFPNGTPFTSFTHRSGSYTFALNRFYGRDGMNFIKIIHTSSTFERETNYMQWVTNPTGSSDVIWGGYPPKYEGEGLKYLSGVKYHTSARAEYYVDGNHFYKYMYSNASDAIQIEVEKGGNTFQVNQIYQSGSLEKTDSAGNSNLYSVSVVDVDGNVNCHERVLYLTASISGGALINKNRSLIADNGDTTQYLKIWTKKVKVIPSNRIYNGDSTDILPQEIQGILIDNRTNNDTLQSETFVSESHRLLPYTYDSQADVTNSTYEWDSSISIEDNGTDGYSGSLLVMPRWTNGGVDSSGEGMLVYPDSSPVPINGDFTAFTNGPDNNVDYSTSTGNRTFYRRFRNVSGNTLSSFIINLRCWNSSVTISPQGTSLSFANLYFHVKLPGETAWLDMGTALAQNSTDDLTIDNAPGRLGSLETISATTGGTDYTVSVATSVTSFSVNNNEYVVVRLTMGDSFLRQLRSITIEDFE